jgi:hypothetical protein
VSSVSAPEPVFSVPALEPVSSASAHRGFCEDLAR